MFTLQILHASDLEGGVDAIGNAPNFAAIVDALEADAAAGGFGSILLSAGDNYIPGPFFNASGNDAVQPALQAAVEALYGLEAGSLSGIAVAPGRIDVTIANILGVDASAIGNHEFDVGPEGLATIAGTFAATDDEGNPVAVDGIEDIAWLGAQFPYLSANLDFSAEDALSGLVADGLLPADAFAQTPDEFVADGPAPTIAPSTILEVDGEQIGVIGATTQLLESISSPGDVEVIGANENDMAALAAILQPEIDALVAAGVTKIVTVSHLQQFALEQELAGLLSGIDVMIAGGSDTIVADDTDRLRPGDEAGIDGYPFFTTDADGNDVAIVSTDGQYEYVGRLVITFDEDGNIVPDSVDADQSGAFATDEEGVLDVTGAASLDDAIAGSDMASEIATLTGAVQDFVDELASEAPGFSSVYLDGRRSEVRTEETNLGNLTAEANLFAARQADPTVQVSIKNGGGIRDDIGDVILDNDGNPSFEPPFDDAVTVLDIQNSLRFDNTLAILDLSAADLKIVLEHAVSATAEGATPGQFPQIAGVRFSVDPEGTAQVLDEAGNVTTEGSRIQSASLIDDDGNTVAILVEDGAVAEDAPASIRVTTLNFLAGGGDSYPFPALGENTLFVTEGFGLTADGDAENLLGEQAALADYLAAEFGTAETAFDTAETGQSLDTRIQFLDERSDTVVAPLARDELTVELLGTFSGVSEPGEGNAEVVSYDSGRLFVTNGEESRIDIFDIGSEVTTQVAPSATIDLSFIDGFAGVQSVVAGGDVVVAVADIEPVDGAPRNGVAAIFDQTTLELITTVETGNLPDGVAISPNGATIAIANEGEFNGESDLTENAPGSVTIVTIADLENPVVNTVGFDGVDASGARIFPGIDPALDLEPEYPVFSPNGLEVLVTLQENNAVAVINLATLEVEIQGLGTVDHSVEGSGLDATDDEVIDILPRTVQGLRMPDAIDAFTAGGATYFVTANEGDGRGDITEGDEGVNVDFGDEARVGDLLEMGMIDESVDTTGLERLTVSTIDGDTDGDGDIDELFSFGSRGFTIFDNEGNVVFDSGDQFETIIANVAPQRFNDDDGELGQNRSDAKGPEPEAIAVGQIGAQTYAFIGAERDSGVFVYNVTDPADARFVTYVDGFENGTIAPETIAFIPEEESATGNAQIAVAYEVSGNTAVYDLSRLESDVSTEGFYEVALGRTVDIAGYDFWSEVLAISSTSLIAEAFEVSNEFQASIEGLEEADAIDLVFNNAVGRDATEDEQAEAAALVAEDGFSELFLAFIEDDAFMV